ncbi:DNA mismatch repair endonuclease MutH [Shewanella submarina]|uniref:DNA mismatch repair protein MutH n=1 Tax=Shewanella submarina TaxID=2016376 RepID=A0ABV7G852_9GAMM|nr:DNA mismatch repair endonuclease MutH [Shewanella submarina]
MTTPAPKDLDELMQRVDDMAGLTLGQLASHHGIPVPENLRRDKGWTGQLIETHLGATAGSKPMQDFIHLGVELKTIPLSLSGSPLETTYVCVAPLINIQGLCWQDSLVKHKLQRVLWVPIEGDRQIPVAQRRIGTGILWEPNNDEEQLLKQDWEEIMELIALGKVESVSARHGDVLQLRPKAANSKVVTEAIGKEGKTIMTNPRGFYLKTGFTASILARAFG